ncbi:MAG: tetratricopeptide repeat protein [Candidatus Eisenbacteria bacterium]|nr:tetratricopeptide repeat protein [Candidatus Eisenbacteria bacterium]
MNGEIALQNLSDTFKTAADRLARARQQLDEGVHDGTAALSSDAIELMCAKLTGLRRNRGERTEEFYSRRWRYTIEHYGLSNTLFEKFRLMHNNRLKDRFQEERTGGPKKPLNEWEGIASVDCGYELLLAMAEALGPAYLTDVAERLREGERASARVLLLNELEHRVNWGLYGPDLDDLLRDADRTFRGRRDSDRALRLWARVTTLKAHRAMNLGQCFGPQGAISKAREARAVWTRLNDPSNLIYSLDIESVALRMIGRGREALHCVERARAIVADIAWQQPYVESEMASVLVAIGEPAEALKILEAEFHRAEEAGDGVAVGRALQQIGIALADLGDWDRAEDHLLTGEARIPYDYVITRVMGRNALVKVYATSGRRNEAQEQAEFVLGIAQEKGFGNELRGLQRTMRDHPDVF